MTNQENIVGSLTHSSRIGATIDCVWHRIVSEKKDTIEKQSLYTDSDLINYNNDLQVIQKSKSVKSY